MDWNKSNTILIVAFIILNIFLFSSSYNNTFSEDYNVVEDVEFIEEVKSILDQNNITVSCDLPKETYLLPILDTEYELIYVNKELLENFLGPGIEPMEDVYTYSNQNGERIEIIDGKKINYVIRQGTGIPIEEKIEEEINEFIKNKKINREGYTESYRYIGETGSVVIYTKKYNNISLDNSYMKFYFDKEGIYGFEMQNILMVEEIAEKIRTFSIAEALPKLLSDGIKEEEIVDVEMTYYSMEDENWHAISRINSYPVWKVIFKDGSQKHLPSIWK